MNKSIVIAEDQAPQRERLALVVARAGYQVFEAENGGIALDYILKNPVDGLITDIGMPEMDGYDLIQSLSRHGVMFPIIILSAAKADRLGRSRVSSYLGEIAYLQKPLSREGENELLTKLQSFVPL